MNLAIVHYHLNRGGVTQVIKNQLLALDAACAGGSKHRAAIFYGGRKQGWDENLAAELKSLDLQLCAVEGLDYDENPVAEPRKLTKTFQQQLHQLEFLPDETVVQAHNHSVGKNVSLPGALTMLAEAGYSLLLQIHDFAEDMRPDNYRLLREAFGDDHVSDVLYPQSEQIHYAVLNRRDFSVLRSTGIDESRLHYLPNPVPDLKITADCAAARVALQKRFGIAENVQYILYPVRGIRRKNLGEALLWSALSERNSAVGVTLAPLNPAEQSRYQRWKEFARKLELPCYFGTGEEGGLSFTENLAAADLILTTSVAEGFGMVFLEAWLTGCRLVGRNLPEITADFVEAGLRFDAVYDHLPVPVEWIDLERFAKTFGECGNRLVQSYGLPPLTEEQLAASIEAKTQTGSIDFADLDEPLQESVIRKVHADPGARGQLRERIPVLKGAEMPVRDLIEANRRRIEQSYSLPPSGQRLLSILQKTVESRRSESVSPPPHGQRVLRHFLDPSRMRLLRT